MSSLKLKPSKKVEPEGKTDSKVDTDIIAENAMTNVEKVMGYFKKDHELIITGKKVFFYHEWTDTDNTPHVVLKEKQVIKDEFGATIKYFDGKGEPKRAEILEVALHGLFTPNVQYKPMNQWKGLCFKPNVKNSRSYNTYKGFAVEPKKGDISIFINTMKKVYEQHELNTVLDWFASMYQKPERKVLWAVTVRGEKGTGKNTLEEMLGRLLMRTENYFRTSDKNALFGKFTQHLASNLLIVGQEIVWGGEHQYDSTIKELITETTRKIEPKGVDAYTLNNYSRLYMTSNAEWVVPASGKSERRYYVIETIAGSVAAEEWKVLYDWSSTKAAKEALMYEMMHRDLNNFDWNKAPECQALSSQLEKGLYGVERYVFEIIEDGIIKTKSDFNNFTTVAYNEYHGWGSTDMYNAFLLKYPKVKITRTKFILELKECFLGGIEKGRNKNSFKPKPREECARFFATKTGVMPLINDDKDFSEEEFFELKE